MKLATHNTMSYQSPKQWWAKILPFIAKCQRVDYKKQHELGAQGYDLRLFWDKDGKIEFRHGIYRYSADNIYEVLNYAEENKIIIRLMLEIRDYNEKSIKNVDYLKSMFIEFCKKMENDYPNIKFYGGRCTGTWEQIYHFKYDSQINEISLYSSVTSLFNSNKKWLKVLDDWCPYLYAKLKNKDNIKKYVDNEDDNSLLSIDFIDIQ